MLWLSASVFLVSSKLTVASDWGESGQDDMRPGVDVAWPSPGLDGQVSISLGDTKVNVEAYNKQREKDIADDSRKLLSLAISLKSDLERDADSRLSPDVIRKATEIEKLAHNVKETMKINMVRTQ